MKVLILGLAKSGTTALAYKIHESMPGDTKLHFEPGKTEGAEDAALHQRITGAEGSAVTKSLIYPQNQTRWSDIWKNVDLYDRAVWIVRDPRDILISNFFYHWYQQADHAAFSLALERTLQKQANPAGLAFADLVSGTMTRDRNQLSAWQQSWYDLLNGAADDIRQRMYILKYEDFVDEKFDGLSDYLGCTIQGETRVPGKHQRVVRTGGYDNWRRWFTEEDVAFFRPIISDFLEKMGYDRDDWALTDCSSLPAREGSDYMKDIYQRGRKQARSSTSFFKRAWRRLRARFT